MDADAWQYRMRLPDGAWSEWRNISQRLHESLSRNPDLQVRELYALKEQAP